MHRCLAIVDEQSSSTFIDERLLSIIDVPKCNMAKTDYNLTTLQSLKTRVEGVTVSNLRVKGLHSKKWINLPKVYTHSGLPDTRAEAAGPETVRMHGHVKSFAKRFSPILPSDEVMVLVGANCGEAMFTRSYGSHYPFVHKMALGYSLVGPVCDDASTGDSSVHAFRTSVTDCEHFSAKTVKPPQFMP